MNKSNMENNAQSFKFKFDDELPILNPNELEEILDNGDFGLSNMSRQEERDLERFQMPKQESAVGADVTIQNNEKQYGFTNEASTKDLQRPSASTNKKVMLDDFLWALLENPKYNSCIQWTYKDRLEFKLTRPEMVAGLWGAYKNKKRMNFDKMSRGLRYYYQSERIERLPYKLHHFKFVNDKRHQRKQISFS